VCTGHGHDLRRQALRVAGGVLLQRELRPVLVARRELRHEPLQRREQRALLDFISANKSCESAADCRAENVGCGITEDDCTGAVYVNAATDLTAFGTLRDRYRACVGDHPNYVTCARLDAPADCINGRCARQSLAAPSRTESAR
jgi:hypothetical protein